MTDTETLCAVEKKPEASKNTSVKSDFPSMCVELGKKINFKTAIFLLIIGTAIFSDVFIENCLKNSEYTDGAGMPTTRGTFIQMITFILAFLVIDLMIQAKIL